MRKKSEERQTRNKIGVMIFYFIQIRTKMLYTIVDSIFIRYRILAMKNWAIISANENETTQTRHKDNRKSAKNSELTRIANSST